jgi:hypothetical protein
MMKFRILAYHYYHDLGMQKPETSWEGMDVLVESIMASEGRFAERIDLHSINKDDIVNEVIRECSERKWRTAYVVIGKSGEDIYLWPYVILF